MGLSNWLNCLKAIGKFLKQLLKWIAFIKIEPDDEKNIKGFLNWLNLVRLIILIPVVPTIIIYFSKDKKFSFNSPNWIKYLILSISIYLVFRLYFDWIKKLWEFLKKDSIIHYIFLALIPIAIVTGAFQSGIILKSCHKKNNLPPVIQTSVNEESTDRLINFYGALFTAIAVIAALIGLGAWRTIKELKEKLNKFKEFEDKVNFVKEKKELAEWAQEIFDKDEEKKMMSTFPFLLSDKDKRKLNKVEKNVIQEATDDSWLKLIHAKSLLDSNTKRDTEEKYSQVESIYLYLKNRDLFEYNSDIKHYLFHLIGQLYWKWYKFKKKNSKEKVRNGDWFRNWREEYIKVRLLKDEVENGDWFRNWQEECTVIKLLKDSIEYYDKAIKILDEKKKNRDESIMNKALPLIEMSKLYYYEEPEKEENKKKAEEKLEAAEKLLLDNKDLETPTHDTYWDRARIVYYKQKFQKNIVDNDEIIRLLKKAVDKIKSIEDINFFIKTMEEELKENNEIGFPGSQYIFEHIKEYVVNRKKIIAKLKG